MKVEDIEMTFEERFPGLKNKHCNEYNAYPPEDRIVFDEVLFVITHKVYNDVEIKAHCLDKQKVEEAICAMVLGVKGPDEILIECQKYIRKVLMLE